MAVIERDDAITREYCIDQAQAILVNSDNERNKLSALSLLGDFIGAKRDNAPNAEKEAAKLALMTVQERKFRLAWEIEQTKLLSEAKTIPIRSA